MTIIAPSILSMDFSKMGEQIKILNQSNAQMLHFDVMDGHFVPNLTFGPDLLKGIKKSSDLTMDVHIMVSDPVFFAEMFTKAGADCVTFHYEALSDIEACIDLAQSIRAQGVCAGISLKPNTPVSVLKDSLRRFDLILIMSVEPGFGGQSFIESSLEKIKTLKTWIEAEKLDTVIQVDGGINQITGKQCVEAGADILVAGSYIFSEDINERIDSLL